MTGLSSRIEAKSKPFAWIGERGTTTYKEYSETFSFFSRELKD